MRTILDSVNSHSKFKMKQCFLLFCLFILTSNIAVAQTTICSGQTFNYTNTTALKPSGTKFTWKVSNVNPAGSVTGWSDNAVFSSSISQLLTNTTSNVAFVTYDITNDVDFTIAQYIVTVNPKPVLTSSATPTGICTGFNFAYTASSNQDPLVNYAWSRSIVPGISNNAASGTGNISEVLTNTTAGNLPVVYGYILTNTVTGCVTNQNVTVAVNAKPVLTSSTSNSNICSGAPFLYTALSSIPSATITWSRAAVANITPNAGSGTTSISETLTNLSNVSAATASYTFALNNAGCTNAQSFNVTVNPTPILSSTLTPPAACSGFPYSYNPTSDIPGLNFTWSRAVVTGINNPTGSGSDAIIETLVNTTTTPISVSYVYTLTNPVTTCSNTQTVTVLVNPTPSVTGQSLITCSAIPFTVSPTGTPIGTTYTWSAPISNPTGVVNVLVAAIKVILYKRLQIPQSIRQLPPIP